MSARDESMLFATEIINAGSSLEIVGDHGSGRSHLLNRLGEYAVSRSLNVIRFEGSAAFAATPLAALGLAGVNVASLGTAFADITAMATTRPSVLFVDDWDDVDDVSWGVLARVRLTTGTPIVSVRLGGTGRIRPFATTGFTHTYQLRLHPLRMRELERALVDEYGHEIDPATMSQLYAYTSGNIGLTRALFEAGRREGRLKVEDDVVIGRGELWSPSMSVIVESIMKPLADDLRRHLEVLALLGPADLDTAILATSRKAVEDLADLAYVEVYASNATQVIAVRQPLVVSYFRHETSNVRRLLIAGDLKELRSPSMLPAPARGREHSTLFVALVHEHERRRLAEARDAWANERTKDTAARLLEVLGRSPNTEAEIPSIIRQSEDLPGTPEGALAWDMWYATYITTVRSAPGDALEFLERRAMQNPGAAPALALRYALLQTVVVSPADPETLPKKHLFPDDQGWLVDQARACIQLVSGDVSAALELALALRAQGVRDSLVDLIAVTALVADGQYSAAKEIAAAGLQLSTSDFDPGELHRYAYMGGFAAFVAGHHGEAEEIVSLVSQLIAPIDEELTHLGIQAVAASISSRRGGAVVEASGDTESDVSGGFPGMHRGWIDAERLRAQGDGEGAGDLLTAVGDEMWDKGFRLAAAYAYLVAAGTDLAPQRLDRLEERVSQVGGLGIESYRLLNIDRITKNLDGLLARVALLEDHGVWAQALQVWERISEIAAERGDDDLAERADANSARIAGDLSGTGLTRTLRRLPTNLTGREREIARLAASGLSNQEIGAMLFVSTRTVESHLGKIMKKSGVHTRGELREMFHDPV
jgi:DNA-binding CsgD family transcriptional regulator